MIEQVKQWVLQNFFSKRDYTDVSRGAQDAYRPVVLDSNGRFGVGEFDVESVEARYLADTRYAIGIQALNGTATIYSYDYTNEVYIPLSVEASTISLKPSGNAALAFTVDASGNIQASARIGTAWTGLTYTNAGGTTWTDFGGGFQAGQYKKFGDMIFVRGLAKRTAGAGTTIAVLPSGYRPTVATSIYVQFSDTGLARVDVDTSGNIISSFGGTGWVTLNLVISIV